MVLSEGPLISVERLLQCLDNPNVRIFDVRYYLQGKRGIDEYEKGHLPGAVFVDLNRDLASDPARGPGRHPLPDVESFIETLSRLGIGRDTIAVAYDDAGGAMASRFWWLLRYFGHGGGVVLDGGINAWIEKGCRLETLVPTVEPAPRLALRPSGAPLVGKAEVVRLSSHPSEDVLLLDARAAERYEGKVEPIDARAGHIPSARSAPFVENLVAPNGVFLPRDALKARFDKLGALDAKTVVCYCGSGVTACHDLLALSLLGRNDVALYEGSWSDWARDSALPIATGPDRA